MYEPKYSYEYSPMSQDLRASLRQRAREEVCAYIMQHLEQIKANLRRRAIEDLAFAQWLRRPDRPYAVSPQLHEQSARRIEALLSQEDSTIVRQVAADCGWKKDSVTSFIDHTENFVWLLSNAEYQQLTLMI